MPNSDGELGNASREIRSSRTKLLAYLLMGLGFVAGSVIMVRDPQASKLTAWSCLIIFGSCSLVFVWLLVRPQCLHLDRAGFEIGGGFSKNPKKIAWTDVTEFFIYRLPRGGRRIGFNFEPKAQRQSALRRFNRLAGAEGTIPSALPGPLESLVSELNEYRSRAQATKSVSVYRR